ncbi:MAG TPA: polysaccharide biosynthesis/export family protein [Thermoanaerobaculia bacterium]|jgi:protein involved in polysaccharide export with SLBB domain
MRVLISVCLLAALCACGPTLTPTRLPPALDLPPSGAAPPEYVLRPGDVLEVKFFYVPELDQAVTVRQDGRISLQLVDEVVAAGRTVAQLRAELGSLYGKTLKDPQLAVILKEADRPRIYVGGEVNRPGLIRPTGSLTALQAIFEAGGTRPTGELASVVVLRNQGTSEPQFIVLNLKEPLSTGALGRDISLQPLDIVFVPKSRIANVNQFVDQYIRQLIPAQLTFGLTYFLAVP